MAAQRHRLWASTAQANQAPLALKLPEGQCSSPEPSLMSLMAGSTVACSRWKRSTSTARPGEVGEKAVVAPAREQGLLGGIGQPGAAHDEPMAAVAGFGYLGDAVGGVGDRGPSVLLDSREMAWATALFEQRTAMV